MDIKKQADELIKKFKAEIWHLSEIGDCDEEALECAIIAQERVVNELETIWGKSSRLSNNFWIIENQIVNARNILTELKNRL